MEVAMTELLEKAIAKARLLPTEEQDEIAEMIMMITDGSDDVVVLDPETRTAVERGLEQARRGTFASDERMAWVLRRR
jgi:hypothetical protein